MGIVVDSEITLKDVRRGKPTVSSGRKAAVLDTLGQVSRTPPGSASGACSHRGSSGTWESQRSPWHSPGMGDRVPKSPGVAWELQPDHEPARETTNVEKQARY